MKLRNMLLLLGLLMGSLHGSAVLNERNLEQSLRVLHVELRTAYRQQRQLMQRYNQRTEAQHRRMLETMKKSNQIGLMLFSQKDDYIFDLTYACHEATEQYKQFNEERQPYELISKSLKREQERYDGLIHTLETLPPSLVARAAAPPHPAGDSLPPAAPRDTAAAESFMLSAQGQYDRSQCLLFAKALRNNMVRLRTRIGRDSTNYTMTSRQLERLNRYATERYHDIQQSVFRNNGANYFNVLGALPRYVSYARRDFIDKYSTSGDYKHVQSEWRGPVVWGYIVFVLTYLILACVLSISLVNVLMRRIKRLQRPAIKQKKRAIILTAGVMLFAVSIMLAQAWLTHNFFVMASRLLVEYAWLLAAIFLSLLVRLNSSQIGHGFKLYTPIVLMGLLIIVMRIVFIPNMLVSLLLPPVCIVFTLWQAHVMKRHNRLVPRSDRFYTLISLGVMVFSCITAWLGYTLIAVEAFIWWLFQLTAIQTITSVYALLDLYERRILRKRLESEGRSEEQLIQMVTRGEYITETWFFDLVHKALVPVVAVYSVLYCIYLAADVFDLSETCLSIFLTPFVDIDGFIRLSLFNIVVVAALFFVFRYANYAAKAFYRHMRLAGVKRRSGERRVRTNEVNLTLGYNVISIVAWGLFLILATVILRIPKSGVSLITAGLATGIGFAMKDLLNNFFYGIQLMAGRLRVGDWIECDGVQGRVESISYQSTQIITMDDCVMSFLNATLFSKNFKNLTRNHSYELVKIPVGVAYGVNINEVRTLLCEALKQVQGKDAYGRDIVDPRHGVQVVFSDFGDNSVDLIVAMWVLVVEKVKLLGRAKEIIYDTLQANNIEIPFPQRDVYIRHIEPPVPAPTGQQPE